MILANEAKVGCKNVSPVGHFTLAGGALILLLLLVREEGWLRGAHPRSYYPNARIQNVRHVVLLRNATAKVAVGVV